MSKLSCEQKLAIAHISGLILANAMIFQEVLSVTDNRVRSLQEILSEDDPHAGFCSHWHYIIKEIDYFPIFNIANEILTPIASNWQISDSIKTLAMAAKKIVSWKASLRHDLMGRIYHRLLIEKKYLGTFYTSIPAATLLLKLALQPDSYSTQWHKLDDVRKLRVGDLACGTGTLLMAAADAITDNYISEAAAKGDKLDNNKLQHILAEDIIHGYDVLLSAIHLTASTLALRAPEVSFKKMNLFSLPLGGPHNRLGSIEFLKGSNVEMPLDLFGAKQIGGKAIESKVQADLPLLDLCVMNPPFTRSVGGNLLFGSLPAKERAKAQTELKRLVKLSNGQANITAGLGSVFVATANSCIKSGGRIALVLPKAILAGVSWKATRDLLARQYRLEYVISSHDPERWNFSENTKLSEVLLIAKKLSNGQTEDGDVVVLNLWRNVKTAYEGLAVSYLLKNSNPPEFTKGQGAANIMIGEEKFGEALSVPWTDLKDQPNWLLPSAFAQNDLNRHAGNLYNGIVWIPGYGKAKKIPLSFLDKIGSLGPDRRGIHNNFKICKAKTAYSAFWGHDAESMTSIDQQPNIFLSPIPVSAKLKEKDKSPAIHLWSSAGRVLITERLRMNTQNTTCVYVSRPVLSNVWWPMKLNGAFNREYYAKALSIWLNSTLGLMMLLIHREDTEGPWIGFKKTSLQKMPIINFEKLNKIKIKRMALTYDKIKGHTFLPFPQMANDPVRVEIDKCICKVFSLPDISILRELLAQEPFICLRRL